MYGLLCSLIHSSAAKDLIHSWLQQGENPSITDGCDRVPSSEVDISSAVTSIMDDLMSKPLDYSSVTREDTKWGTDPRVAMEMRHKRVCSVLCKYQQILLNCVLFVVRSKSRSKRESKPSSR